MEDYKNLLAQKLGFLTSMLYCYKVYSVPKDWFNVAVVDKIGERNKKGTVHGYGTTFKMCNLIEIYKRDFENFIKDNDIECTKSKNRYIFSLKNYPRYQ